MSETPPLQRDGAGTLVIRDRRIVYASDGVAALCQRPAGEIVGTGFLDLVAPEDRDRIDERHARRLRGEPVPSEYELALLLPDGRRRAVEFRVTLDGRDVVVQVRDVSAQAERRPRLEALAALGAGIQRERSEAAVLVRVREGLWELGLACALMRAEPDGVTLEWARLPAAMEEAFRERLGRPLAGFRGAWSRFARAVWGDGAAYSDDWGGEAAAFVPVVVAEQARSLAVALGLSRAVGVRLDERTQARFHLVVAGDWLQAGDVAAIRLFGAQVAAALDAARAIADLSRRNAELAALSRLGELAGEAGDPPAFFARASKVVRDATGCAGLAIYVLDEPAGALVRSYASGSPPQEEGAPPRLPLSSPVGEVARDRLPRVVPRGDGPAAGAAAWVPLVARSRVVGVLAATFHGGPESVRARLEVLAAAAAHFAGAIEAHALFSDLRRRVGELTLLNDIALASAQLDPVLLLDAALRRVAETLEADTAAAYLRDGERLLLVTGVGLAPEAARGAAQLPLGVGLAGQAVQRLAPVTSPGGASPEEATGADAALGGAGPAVAVPLLAKSHGLGALVLGRRAARPFSPGDVSLLAALGVQLGVTVENARLFSDVRRRLSDLEAVHALALRIFGNVPGDVRALLDDGCREVARAFGGRAAAVYLAEDGGGTLRLAAGWGSTVVTAAGSIGLEAGGLAAEAFRRRAPAWTEDASKEPPGSDRAVPGAPPLAMLAVPLTSREATRGVLFVADDPGRAFTDPELALANALAGELAVGVENAELYADAQRRVEEMGVLHEVGRSLVATLDIEQVLDAGARNLARIVGCERAFLTFATEDGEALEVRAVFGLPASAVGLRLPIRRPQPGVGVLVFQGRAPLAVEDAEGDPRVDQALRGVTGARAYLGVPLLVRDRSIGAAVVVETGGPRAFTPAEVERAAAVANQLAVAAENARLYEDLRRSYAELARAQRQLIQQERLAALGELSAVVAHEVRNPLGVIFNSLGSLRRLLKPTGDARMLLDIVGEEADRLNRIVGDLLDFARPSTPEVRPEPLSRVVDEAVAAALAQNPAGVKLVREPDEELPPVPLDPRLVRQAVLNLAVNAVQAMPRGGRLSVRVRREPGAALLEIEDTGPGIPEEVRDRIFEPFFTTKASGTGLGLAVVKRIVDGHGGEISVTSRPGQGTIFALRFPLTRPELESEEVGLA